jgi:hypothetical protein
MNVWFTVVACIAISSASLGMTYYIYAYHKIRNSSQQNSDNDENTEELIENVLEIEFLSNNINKLLLDGKFKSKDAFIEKNINWIRYPLVMDNYSFKIWLSIGRQNKDKIDITKYESVISFNPTDCQVNLVLSGAYFNEFVDDFIMIDDISNYNKETGVYTFDNKPLFKFNNIKDLSAKIEHRTIKLSLIV